MDGGVPSRQRDVQAGGTRGDSLAQTFRVSSHQLSLIRRFRREQSGVCGVRAGGLTLAYAITIYKSQGSEAPAVVVPVLNSHHIMLQRNLLYTAITRARRLVVPVGDPKAIATAVRNDKVLRRYSALAVRMAGPIHPHAGTSPDLWTE